jgi:hypothetical protein
MDKYIVWNENTVHKVFEGYHNLDIAIEYANSLGAKVSHWKSNGFPCNFIADHGSLIIEQSYVIDSLD